MTMILRPDGTPDYAAMTKEIRLHPRTIDTPQSLAAELRLVNIRERERVNELVRTGGLEALQAECDAADNSFRRQQEAEGKLRTEAESLRLHDAIAARTAEGASNPTPILDAQVAAKREYDEAMAAIANRTVEPLSEAEGIAELERLRSIRSRFDAAQAESRKPDVAAERF